MTDIIRKKNKKQEDDYRHEQIQMIPVTIQEHKYDVDDEIKNDNSIIGYEFNLIELPIFSKNDRLQNGKAQKYIFSEKDNSYVYIVPSADPNHISNKVLQEFDEKVFLILMKLSREQNNQTVITDYFTLAEMLGIKYNYKNKKGKNIISVGNKEYLRLQDSIQRMFHCRIEINGVFYNAQVRQGGLNSNLAILDNVTILTFDKFLKLSPQQQEQYKPYFRNSKIKEILILKINDKLFFNIENKGYLNFDCNKLLEIENSVDRKLYLLLMKWQGYEKKTKIIRTCKYLASRIPLSWEKNTIPKTIINLENRCYSITGKKLIKDFELTKTKPLQKSYIEFEFFTNNDHDKLKDKAIYQSNQKLITKTGHENIAIEKFIETDVIDIKPINLESITQPQTDAEPTSKDDIDITISDIINIPKTILDIIPNDYQRNKKLLKTIASFINDKGEDYVKIEVEYSVKHSNQEGAFHKFLIDSLTKGWGNAKLKKVQDSAPIPNEIFNLIPTEHIESVQDLISKYITSKGLDYVRYNIIYANKKAKDNYGAYLAGALEKNWGMVIFKEEQAQKEAEKAEKEHEEYLKQQQILKQKQYEKEMAEKKETDRILALVKGLTPEQDDKFDEWILKEVNICSYDTDRIKKETDKNEIKRILRKYKIGENSDKIPRIDIFRNLD
ncbi:MAG: hypothetical protein HQK76_16400 [Desulfobacterales bacterium]|nr:hypothetical protein [Desulfobacterales bacterium]